MVDQKPFPSHRNLAGDRKDFGIVKEDAFAELEDLSEEHGHEIRTSVHGWRSSHASSQSRVQHGEYA